MATEHLSTSLQNFVLGPSLASSRFALASEKMERGKLQLLVRSTTGPGLGQAVQSKGTGRPEEYRGLGCRPRNKVNIAVELVTQISWFPSASNSYVGTIMLSIKCAMALCLKKQCTYLNEKYFTAKTC